jgi:hypothetical protein
MTTFDLDDRGVTSAVEFILTFSMAAFIFTFFVLSINGLFLDQSKYIVGTNQFTDISNSVGTKIIETYLIAPQLVTSENSLENGTIITYFDIPQSIEGSAYVITINPFDINEKINVASVDRLVSVNSTLNAAGETIPINGKTNSTDILHKIEYVWTGEN